MARHADDVYGDEGSVPGQVAVNGSGAGPLSVRASPADMGAAVGAGVEKVGQAAEGLADMYGKMVNETLLTNADSALAQKVGQIKGEYLQNTGLAAAAAFPKYQADLEAARQEARANLPLGAQHGFDMLATRTIANHEADGSTYAAGQVRAASIDSGTQLSNIHMHAALDPDVAKDPERVQWHQDSAIYGLQQTMDENHPGLKQQEDGTINFDESKPEGRALKAQYEAGVDNIITQTQTNRFNTLAKGDVLGAFGIYQKERDTLPRPAQVQLDAMFEPRVFNAHVNNVSNQAITEANHNYAQTLYNPQSLAARNNNPGNLRDSTTGQFRVFSTPEEGAKAMQDDLTAKISGNSPAMERNFGKGYSPTLSNLITTYAPAADKNDPKAYTDSVSKETGISPNQVLTVADIPKLQAAMTKVEVGGTPNGTTTPAKSYATNPDGSKLTTADYYRTHSEDVLQKVDAYAESTMPGDLAFKRAARETATNYMNKTIANQSAQYTLDNKNVMRGITGEFTKGKPPETEQELRAIPGMDDLLNRVSAQDPRFAEGIPTMIAKTMHQNTVANTANGYDAIQAVLDRSNSHDRQSSIEYLAKGLGSDNPGFSISKKDFNDAKPGIDLDDPSAKILSDHMKQIATANGNIDGKGNDRAVQWYNQVMTANKQNEALGDKKDKQFWQKITDDIKPPTPSIMKQVENWVSGKSKETQIPTLTDKAQFDALPRGSAYIRDGQQYRKP